MSNFSNIFVGVYNDYADSCKASNVKPTCKEVADDVLNLMYSRINIENAILDKGNKMKIPYNLPPYIIAPAIKEFNDAILISRTTTVQADRDGSEGLYLAAYEDDPASPRYGLYSEDKIDKLAREYNPSINRSGIQEVREVLRMLCKDDIHELTRDKNLVAVHNGIYDIANKQLLEFSSDYIFLTKSRVDFNAAATTCPVITNPDGITWDVDTWIREIANNEAEIEQLLWEVIAAVLRSNHSYDKAALFYSPKGANGKGTFCEMLKAIVPYAPINLSSLSNRFGLASLKSPVAMIISDENSTEFVINDATVFKCLVTHDPVNVERKYADSVEMTFEGLVVQCINKLPKITDISHSLIRRLMIVPFKQQYAGKENRMIKEDYVHRSDVLEYVVHKALDMDFDGFNVPVQCELLVENFVEANNPVYSFFSDIESKFRWTLVPNTFIYALYVKWMAQNVPGEKPLGRNIFLDELRNILDKFDNWEIVGNGTPTAAYIFGYEPLIGEYGLYDKWGDPRLASYEGMFSVNACTPHKRAIPTSTGGIRRKMVGSPVSVNSYSDDET